MGWILGGIVAGATNHYLDNRKANKASKQKVKQASAGLPSETFDFLCEALDYMKRNNITRFKNAYKFKRGVLEWTSGYQLYKAMHNGKGPYAYSIIQLGEKFGYFEHVVTETEDYYKVLKY